MKHFSPINRKSCNAKITFTLYDAQLINIVAHIHCLNIWTRVCGLIFWPILKVKLCIVLDTLSVFVNITRRYCHTAWAKN